MENAPFVAGVNKSISPVANAARLECVYIGEDYPLCPYNPNEP